MFDSLHNYLPDLPTAAGWASIVSLFVSGYAAIAITKVRSQIVSRIRLPALLEIIENHGKSIAKLMGTYDESETKENLILELTVCEANLRLVKSKVARGIGSHTKTLMREISRYKRVRWFGYYPAITTRDQAWKIYAELNGLIQELNNVVEEQTMGA